MVHVSQLRLLDLLVGKDAAQALALVRVWFPTLRVVCVDRSLAAAPQQPGPDTLCLLVDAATQAVVATRLV
jgi:hypothetical protein